MLRTSLLATVAFLCALAPSYADGAGGKRLTGLGDVGYSYTGLDISSSSSDLDISQFHGTGSALWTWPGKWNFQGNFNFASDRFSIGSSPDLAADYWKLGGALFYRDQTQGYLGGEINYQSIDVLGFADGVSITGRGEAYLSDFNLGGYLGYTTYSSDGSSLDTSGWQLGAYGKYYSDKSLGFKLGLDYANYEVDSTDYNDLSINGEAEYMIPDCTTSLYAGLGFGTMDIGTSDADYWRFGLGLRVHFGTDGSSLMDRNRNEPISQLAGTRFIF
ncbi:MAG: hypothetical protein ABL973_06025 [Micropepsaceae bacterium]